MFVNVPYCRIKQVILGARKASYIHHLIVLIQARARRTEGYTHKRRLSGLHTAGVSTPACLIGQLKGTIMKTTKVISGLLAGLALMAAASGMAANVDVTIGLPGYYVEPRPVYVQPQYENDWRERRVRANQWRAEDHHDHGHNKSHKKHKKQKHNHKHH